MKKILILGIFFVLLNNVITAQNTPFHNDQVNAKRLCDKNQYTEPILFGCGSSIESGESHSAWYKFKIQTGGTLDFVIQPLNPNDDIDFTLSILNAGIYDTPRSAKSGPFVRGSEVTYFKSNNSNKTGLKAGEPDTHDSNLNSNSPGNSMLLPKNWTKKRLKDNCYRNVNNTYLCQKI